MPDEENGGATDIPVKVTKVNPTWTAQTADPGSLGAQPIQPISVTPEASASASPQRDGPAVHVQPAPPLTPSPTPSAPPAPQVIPIISAPTTPSPIPSMPPVSPPLVAPQTPPVLAPIPPELTIKPLKEPGHFSWKPLVIGLIVILLLAGAAAFMGFQGILFGPPADARLALKQASEAIAKAGSYHASGQGTLVMTLAAGSEAVSVPVEITGDRANATTGQLTTELDLSGLPSTVFPTTLPSLVEVEIRRVDGTLYMHAPLIALLTGSTDTESFTTLPDTATGSALPLTDAQLATLVTNGSRVGFEQVGIDQTAKYHYTLNGSTFLSLIRADLLASDIVNLVSGATVTLDVWNGLFDHLPRKLAINVANQTAAKPFNLTLTAQLTKVGTAVTIVAPTTSELSSVSTGSLELTDLFAAALQKVRDEQRKAHIRSIQTALELFKKDQGTYPTTAGAISKTSDAATPLAGLVSKNFLSSLPVDPLEPDFWYGYKSSDGSAYEVWSVLEDPLDVEGTDQGSLHLFMLTNSEVAVTEA